MTDLLPIPTATSRQPVLIHDAFSASAWDGVLEAVNAIARYKPTAGEPLRPTPPDVAATARLFVRLSRLDLAAPIPDGVYPLPDGNVMFEWNEGCGIIVRAEIEPNNCVQVMTTYPDGRAAEFADYKLKSEDRDLFLQACIVKRRHDTYEMFGTEFSLAS